MTAMVALIKREYLEHRGAFIYAPAIILGLLIVALVGAFSLGKLRVPPIAFPSGLKIFEIGFLGMGVLWFVYLMAALFFYYADAFNADRRNNAMFFWKSMPLSDFKILSSKMLAGLTIFPLVIVGAFLVSGVVVAAVTYATAGINPRIMAPDLIGLLSAAVQVVIFDIALVALALLWYAPFYAWIGGLSTLVGRWSIPLAFLIPALIGAFENIFLKLDGPDGGYVLSYLRQRSHFGLSDDASWKTLMADAPFDAFARINELLATIDWAQMSGGLIVAALLVYAASEYRRRIVAT